MITLLTVLAFGPSARLDESSLPVLDRWVGQRGLAFVRTNEATLGVQELTFQKTRKIQENGCTEMDVVFQPFEAARTKQFPSHASAHGFETLANEEIAGFDEQGILGNGYRRGLPSGIPLGAEAWTESDARTGDVKLRFRTAWMRGDVMVDPWQGFPADPGSLGEGTARIVIGLVESRRLLVTTRRTLSGTPLPAYQTDAALAFGDLSAWASLRGWTAKLDDDRQVKTLTKGSHTLVIPLGALAVKVDGAWKDLPDVTMLKDGKWWVPLDALEAAAKA